MRTNAGDAFTESNKDTARVNLILEAGRLFLLAKLDHYVSVSNIHELVENMDTTNGS